MFSNCKVQRLFHISPDELFWCSIDSICDSANFSGFFIQRTRMFVQDLAPTLHHRSEKKQLLFLLLWYFPPWTVELLKFIVRRWEISWRWHRLPRLWGWILTRGSTKPGAGTWLLLSLRKKRTWVMWQEVTMLRNKVWGCASGKWGNDEESSWKGCFLLVKFELWGSQPTY